jgi:hypothetical protein
MGQKPHIKERDDVMQRSYKKVTLYMFRTFDIRHPDLIG